VPVQLADMKGLFKLFHTSSGKRLLASSRLSIPLKYVIYRQSERPSCQSIMQRYYLFRLFGSPWAALNRYADTLTV
jgi:hypothetical protein